MENNKMGSNDSSSEIGILEQSFTQLPAEGKYHLKKYLENLVSMQNTMARAYSAEDERASSNEK